MKKIIRNLLVGIIPFFPFEKVHAETYTDDTTDTSSNQPVSRFISEAEKASLRAILDTNSDTLGSTAGVKEIEKLRNLLDEVPTEGNKTPSIEVASHQVVQTAHSSDKETLPSSQENRSLKSITKITPVRGKNARSDVEELLMEMEKDTVKIPEVPLQEKGWFMALASLGVGFLIPGGVLLIGKIERSLKRKKHRQSMPQRVVSATEQTQMPPSVEEPPVISFPAQFQGKTENKVQKADLTSSSKAEISFKAPEPQLIIVQNEEEAHKKGIRMLANIQARRTQINRQMKYLRSEFKKYPGSDKRYLATLEEMTKLENERKKLAMSARQARALIKGKQGELIKEQRRLLTKEMTLARRTQDMARAFKIMQKRQLLKAQEKQIMQDAKAEIKKRAEQAEWWHGKRFYTEALTQEANLKKHLKDLQKQTGLKRDEVLAIEEDLALALKKVQKEKRLALRQMKGRQFTNKRRLLSKQLIAAHRLNDTNAEERLKQELADLKVAEKAHLEHSKNVDYAQVRIGAVPRNVATRSQKRRAEAEERQSAEQRQKERDERALFWRGQRMLRDLSNGLSESVNLNQITPQDYKKWAYGMIGNNWVDGFNYDKERPSVLKPTTLLKMYQNKRNKG